MAKAKTKATTTTKKMTKKPSTAPKKVTTKKKVKSAAAPQGPFLQVRITDQTLYWLIFGTVSVMFAMWIYMLDSKVRDLYDQIDVNTYSVDTAVQVQALKEKTAEETE